MKNRLSVEIIKKENSIEIKYTWNNRADPLEGDGEVLRRVSFGREASMWAIREFKGSNNYKELKEALSKRNKWIEVALQDPYLTDEEREFIKNIPIEPKIRKDNQFRSTLIHAWKPLYDYLINIKDEKPHKAASLIIDLLTGLFPTHKEIQSWLDDTEINDINKALIAAPPSSYPNANITLWKKPK
jgi:hypothetical protein